MTIRARVKNRENLRKLAWFLTVLPIVNKPYSDEGVGMKSLMPWVCIATAMNTAYVFADEGLDAYRLGHYHKAATLLNQVAKPDPVVDYYLAQMRLYGYGEVKNDAIAAHYLKDAAEKNLLPAQQLLARYELLKNHRLDQALFWFKKAAEANDVDAQMYCAAAYMFGLGVSKNQDTAKRYYIAAAKNGNALAQYTVAEGFLDTRHAANNKLGMLWLIKSANQNYPAAQALLAAQYIEGKSVERDFVKAKLLLDAAMAQNEPSAFYQMGQIERAQNRPEEAIKWYTKAATPMGYVPALLAMSSLYLEEKSPLYNPHEAFLCALKAAQLNDHAAQQALSAMYKKGVGVEANEQLAKEWQQKSNSTSKVSIERAQQQAVTWLTNGKQSSFDKTVYAMPGILGQWQNLRVVQQNNYNAYPEMAPFTREMLFQPQFKLIQPAQIPIHEFHDMLVKLSDNATPVSLDFPQYMLYSSSTNNVSKLTSIAALHNMAVSTADAKQYTELFKKLEQQAILGNSSAQFDIAVMYQYGIGVEKNAQQALKFYQLAADQQDLQAEYNLGLLYLLGTDMQPDYTKATDWLTDAAFKGNDYAQYALARIYDYGYRDVANQEVIPANLEKAMAMYNLAAANGSGFAQYRLAEILVRQNHAGMSLDELQKQNQLIKDLYTSAVKAEVKDAQLPLAFYDAMDTNQQKQQQAFDVAKQAAESGNQEAALLLGLMYDRGIAVKANQDDALYWYKKAKENPLGAFMIGTYMAEGIGSSRDLDESQVLLQKAADKGFSYAYLNLAVIKHQQEKPFLPDLNKALDLGNASAGILLADYYLKQFNEKENLAQARKIYQQFAEKGDKTAQLKLGFLAEHGIGGNADLTQAQQWYTAAADQQLPEAQYLLARFYQLGKAGQIPDYAAAKKWYAAAEPKYPPAAIGLGFVYDTVDENYAQALAAYQRAADKGNVIAAYNLGLIYERGEGCPVDLEKAQALYIQAAGKGYTQAMVQLAGIYLVAEGKLNDVDEAVNWYKKAAEKGSRDAMYQLGLMSETGVGVRLDYTGAMHYYEQSAERGDVKATLALARLYQYGIGVTQDMQKAAQLYTMLSQQGNPYAQYQLALFCFKGIQCQPDQAKQWLAKAQSNGSFEAARTLQWLNAQTQSQVSFIEPMLWVASSAETEDTSENRLYLNALNAWNLGDEATSKTILTQLLNQDPDNERAKQAYQQLQHADLVVPMRVMTKSTVSLK